MKIPSSDFNSPSTAEPPGLGTVTKRFVGWPPPTSAENPKGVFFLVVALLLLLIGLPISQLHAQGNCANDTIPPTITCPQGQGPQNMLINASFENGAVFNVPFNTDWNVFGPAFAIDANIIGPGQDGNFYLKLFGGNTGLFQDHPVSAGDNLAASVYIENASFDPMLPGCEGFIKLEYFNTTGGLISVSESNRINHTLPQNTWTQITLNDVAPAGAATVRYVVIMQCNAGGAVMFDNASLINQTQGSANNITVNNDPGQCGAVVFYNVTPNDNCPGLTVAQTSGFPNAGFHPAGVTTNAFTVTDAAGNQASCSFTVTVVDTEAPTIDCSQPQGPSNLLSNASFETGAVFNQPFNTNWNTFGPVFAIDANIIGPGQDGNFYLKTFGGNTGLFQDVPVQAGDNLTASVYIENASFDPMLPGCEGFLKLEYFNSTGGVISVSESNRIDNTLPQNTWTQITLNDVAPAGAVTVRYVIIMQCNAGGAVMFDNARLENNTQGGGGLIGNVSVNNDPGQCGAQLSIATPFSSDICGVVSLTNSFTGTSDASGFYPVGVTNLVWTATDAAGNSTSCSVQITVTDIEGPAIVCPGNMTVNNDPGQCGAVVGYGITPSDNCPAFTVAQTSGLPNAVFHPLGVTTNAFTVTDLSGNQASCSFDVTVIDAEAPTIACPQGQGGTPSNILTNASFENGAVFNVPFNTDWTPFGPAFAIDANIIPPGQDGNFYLKLFGGNTGLFQDHPVNAGDSLTASVYIENASFDPMLPGCEGFLKLEYFNSSGGVISVSESNRLDNTLPQNQWTQVTLDDVAPAGAVTVRFVVIMQCNAGGAVMFDDASLINQSQGGGGSAVNIMVNNDPGECGAVVFYNVTPGDNCPGFTVAQTSGFPNAGFHPAGVTTNSFTVTDAAGNQSSCSFTVTVVDTEAPVIDCSQPAGAANLLNNASFENGAAFNQPFNTDWNVFGPAFAIDANIIGPGQDGNFYLKLFGGNTGLFQDHPVNAGDNLTASVYIENASFDPMLPSCVGFIKLEYFNSTGGVISVSESNRIDNTLPQNTWTQITLNDVVPAGAVTVRYVVIMQCSAGGAVMFDDARLENNTQGGGGLVGNVAVNNDPGQCGAQLSLATPFSSDVCGVISLTNSFTGTSDASGFYPIGNTTVVWTATDAAGNATSCSVEVSVTDNELPTIVCPADMTVNNDPGQCGAVVNYGITPNDNCPAFTVAQTSGFPNAVFHPAGVTTNAFTVTDLSGNQASCSFDVTVVDAEAPTIACPQGQGGTPSNILTNASFENGAVFNVPFNTDWSPFGPAFAIDANIIPPGQDGNFYLKLFGGNTGLFQDHPVNAGDSLTASVYIENASFDPMLPGCEGFLKLEYFNSTGGVISVSESNRLDHTLPQNQWTQVTLNDVAPAGAVTVRFVVIMQCNAGGAVMFDDASLINQSQGGGGATITVNNDPGQCGAVVFYNVTPGDNCPGFTVAQTSGFPNAGFHPAGVTTNAFTVTDAAGNQSSCSFTVTVVDTEAPVIDCSQPAGAANLLNNASFENGAAFNQPFNTDWNVFGPAFAIDANIIGPGQDGNFYLKLFGGNTGLFQDHPVNAGDNLTASVYIENASFDPMLPGCVGFIKLEYFNSTGGVISVTESNRIDNTLPQNTWTQITLNDMVPAGAVTVRYVVIMQCSAGGAVMFDDARLENNTQGGGGLVGNVAVNNDPGQCGAQLSLATPFSSDVCGVISLTNSFTGTSNASGFYPVGNTTVVWTATDAAGNSTSCSVEVTVTDVEIPTIVCPVDITVNNDPGQCGAVVSYGVTPNDNCPAFTVAQTSGFPNAVFHPAGVTTNAFTVTDLSGNQASCSFTVTVVDAEAPIVDCSRAQGAGNLLNNPSFENGAAFNQPFNADWNTFGAIFAIDANIIPPGQDGNFYLKMFGGNTGLFQDHPVQAGDSLTASVYIQNASFDPMLPGCEGFIKLEYFNNTGGVISVSESNRINNTLPQNTWTQITLDDVVPAGAVSVRYVVIMQCSAGGAVMFDDASLINTTANGGGLAGNVTVDNDPGQCGAQLTLAVPANSDACGVVSMTNSFNGTSDASGFYPIGTTTVTWTAIDAAGNSTSCSVFIMVSDNEAPVLVCPADLTLDCVADVPAANINDVTVSDNCPGVVVMHIGDDSNGGSGCAGDDLVISRNYEATDAAGNVVTCMQTITVNPVDLTLSVSSPTYPGGTNVSCNGATDGSITATVANGCGPYTYQWDDAMGQTSATAIGLGAGTYSVIVTDANGCALMETITLTEPDAVAASLSCCEDEAICNGDSTSLTLTFEGDGPWIFTYTDGTDTYTEVATASPYELVVAPDTTTTYTLSTVTSGLTNCAGTVCGRATIGVNQCTVPCGSSASSSRSGGRGNGRGRGGFSSRSSSGSLDVDGSGSISGSGSGSSSGSNSGSGSGSHSGSTSSSGSADLCVSPCADLGITTNVISVSDSGGCRTVTLEVMCDAGNGSGSGSASSGSSADWDGRGSRSRSRSGSHSQDQSSNFIEIFTNCGTVTNVESSCGDATEILDGSIRVYRLPKCANSNQGSGSSDDLDGSSGSNSRSRSSSSSSSSSDDDCRARDSFTITYTICEDGNSCATSFCSPLVGYSQDGCTQYESSGDLPVPCTARTIDFDTDAAGNAIPAGAEITNQYASFGFLVSVSNNRNNHPDKGIIFDSANPTGGDPDLGAPNAAFGGPGVGAGGAAGATGENAVALGNVLIIAENDNDSNNDGLVDNPDDEARGGEIRFTFANPTEVQSVHLLDLDDRTGGSVMTCTGPNGTETNIAIPNLGDNSTAVIPIQAGLVNELKINFSGSGAVAGFTYCDGGSTKAFANDFGSEVEENAPEELSGFNSEPNVLAYPNPFRDEITFELELFQSAETKIIITDLAGKTIRIIEPGLLMEGTHKVTWNGKDNVDLAQSNGVYFARILMGNQKKVVKVILQK